MLADDATNELKPQTLLYSSFKGILQHLGPGIVMAGATIGVSHLVQAPRAGAYFGLHLLLIVIIINILKYPFYEFGHRYYAATNQNLLIGYKNLGKRYLLIFFLLNVISALFAITALSYVCAGTLAYLLDTKVNIVVLMTVIHFLCIFMLLTGKYRILRKGVKSFLLVIIFFTIVAFFISLLSSRAYTEAMIIPWRMEYLPFIIALMGWMPGPIEVSVWQSLWVEEKMQRLKKNGKFKFAKFDFCFGYGLSMVMALMFLSLGAFVLGRSGITLSQDGVVFTGQLVSIYTSTIGQWVGYIISIAIFITLFSTTLTAVDIYPRSIILTYNLLFKKDSNISKEKLNKTTYALAAFYGILSVTIVLYHSYTFTEIVDRATIIAFLVAPIFAFMNYKLIFSKNIFEYYKPGVVITTLSRVGLVFLMVSAVFYLHYIYQRL